MASRKDSKGAVLPKGFSQRKDGLYVYRRQVNKKTHTLYNRSLPELKQQVKELERDIDAGIDVAKSKDLILDDCFYNLMKSKLGIRDTTADGYVYNYEHYIQPTLGKKKIDAINAQCIKDLYIDIRQKGLSVGSLKNIDMVLSMVLQDCVDNDYIRRDYTTGIFDKVTSNAQDKKREKFALTEAEVVSFMSYVQNSNRFKEYAPLFTILLGSGMRIGEALGLTWNDIDFKEESISINKTLYYKAQNGNAAFCIHPPKTFAGHRTIPMRKEVKNAFLKLKEERLKKGMCIDAIDGHSDFVFYNAKKHLYQPSSINRTIKTIVKYHNQEEDYIAKEEKRKPFHIREFSAHIFRHTTLTRMAETESNPKILQAFAGHSNYQTTMNIYAKRTTLDILRKTVDDAKQNFYIG